MDLEILKGLKLTDEKDKNLQQPQTTTDQPKQEHLLDKLSSAFSSEKPSPPVVAPPPEPEHRGLIDKLSHTIAEHSNSPQPPSQPVEPKHEDFLTKASHLFGEKSEAAPPPEPKHENLVDKITGALAGERHEVVQPPPPPPVEHKNIFERIGDAFSGEKDIPPPPPPAPKSEGLSDKIYAALHGGEEKAGASQLGESKKDIFDKLGLGNQPESAPAKEESLLDKLGSKFHHEAPKEPTFGEKLGSRLGLGKTEQEEDHLDKTIDFVQEHILHQGDQHNEGQFEQFKDDRIASAIRSQYKHATGHEFPSSSKEEK